MNVYSVSAHIFNLYMVLHFPCGSHFRIIGQGKQLGKRKDQYIYIRPGRFFFQETSSRFLFLLLNLLRGRMFLIDVNR